MPADGTQIKQDINNDLGNKGYRGVRTFMIIATLIKVVDWVTSVVNNNLTTWLKQSDNSPGGGNADAVYRTGNTEFRGGVVAKARTPDSSALANLSFGYSYPIQLQGLNGGPAFLEFHIPGIRMDQLGIDTDGILKIHPWTSLKAYPLVIDTLTSLFKLAKTTGRKLVLYEINDNENQYYGLGVDVAGLLTYIVPEPANDHVFYAATSAATRKELLRIKGNGNVSINSASSSSKFSVDDADPNEGVIAQFGNTVVGGNGARIRMLLKSYGQWDVGLAAGVNAFVIVGWNGSGMSERLRITQEGRFLLGQTTGTDRDLLQVNGSISGKYFSQASNPSSSDVPSGYSRLVKNTSNGEVRLWVNDGGTMKSVLLS